MRHAPAPSPRKYQLRHRLEDAAFAFAAAIVALLVVYGLLVYIGRSQ